MRILVLSDLHFEFQKDAGRSFCEAYRDFHDYDVAVIAGDVSNFAVMPHALRRIEKTFNSKPIVYTIGNHECYGSSLPEANATAQAICNNTGLVFLRNSAHVISGQRFIGGTLWFRHDPYDPESYRLERGMTDFTLIRGLRDEVDAAHRETHAYLGRELGPEDVLVTHHLPSPKSIHPKYTGSPLNRFFVGYIEDLIAERQPRLVIHGHTHESCDYMIGGTRVVCNPLGYAGSEINPNFIERCVVEI